MKATKYILIGAMMIGFSAPALAQEEQAMVATATQIIKSKPADLKDQLKPLYKKIRKKPEALVQLGKVFMEQKDTANARVYANHALKADNKFAQAYILLGDIEAELGNGGEAAKQYDQAIYFDPKNPDAYYKYASVYRKVDLNGAVQKLKDLHVQRPDIAVAAQIGHIYYSVNEFKQAAESYKEAGIANLNDKDLTEFAMALYFSGKYQESADVVKAGLAKAPRDAAFNRLALFNYTELKDYENALTYANKLFNESDKPEFSYLDYVYYGNALNGAKRGAEAIDMYKKALEQNIDNKDKRAGVYKQMAEAYEQAEDFENAINSYNEYLANLSKSSVTELADLGKLYIQHAGKQSDEAAKKDILKKAENVYAEMEKNPDALEYAIFWRARVNTMLDPESSEGLAKPYYEKLMQTIEAKAEKSKADIARVIECYRYMAAYSWLTENKEDVAYDYYNKILTLSPEDPQAKQAAEVLAKKLNK